MAGHFAAGAGPAAPSAPRRAAPGRGAAAAAAAPPPPRAASARAAFHARAARAPLPPAAAAALDASPPPGAAPAAPGGQRMILADAMALLYRSHFAFSPDHRLRTAAGEDTTVEFGFLSSLLALLELDPAPTHLAVVFDAGGKTFRHELYRGYKGHRPDSPPEIRAAVPRLARLLRALGLAELAVPGVEADDAIGTLAARGVAAGFAVAVASPDKDFFQLLRPGLVLLRPPKRPPPGPPAPGERRGSKFALLPYTEADFRAEWAGLAPAQFVDLLALMGDASDNVPGVAGVGPKTAQALLLEHGSLAGVLANAAVAKPKRAAAALASVEGAAAAKLSLSLVEIRTNLDLPPVQVPLAAFEVRLPPADGGAEAMAILESMELRTHAARLQALFERRRPPTPRG